MLGKSINDCLPQNNGHLYPDVVSALSQRFHLFAYSSQFREQPQISSLQATNAGPYHCLLCQCCNQASKHRRGTSVSALESLSQGLQWLRSLCLEKLRIEDRAGTVFLEHTEEVWSLVAHIVIRPLSASVSNFLLNIQY